MEINVTRVPSFSSFLTPNHSVVPDFETENILDHKETVSIR